MQKNRVKNIRELLIDWQFSPEREKSQKYVRHEHQDYGLRLASKLNDMNHRALYIKLAKNENRTFLEQAYRFAVDYPKMEGKNRGRLFMFALKKLKSGKSLNDFS